MNPFTRAGAALGFLTVAPGMPHAPEALARSAVFFPAVGALIGLLLWGLFQFLSGHFSIGVLALFLLLANTLLSKALHLDGLADTADALLSHRSRERMLEIMRDSRIGAMGALALFFDLFLRWQLLQEMPLDFMFAALFLAPVLGRMAMAAALQLYPYAREQGLASVFASGHRSQDLLIVLFSGLILAGMVATGSGMILWSLTLMALVFFMGWCKRHLGGYTGDTLGALNEGVEILVWLYLVMLA